MTPHEEKAPPRPHLTQECENDLMIHAGFEDQRAPGSHARQHIDQCASCQQYLARREWERRKEEELLSSADVEDLVAKYAKRFQLRFWRRRKVQVAAAILAVLLVLTALGVFAVRSLRAAGVSGGPAASFMGVLGVGIDAWFGHGGPRPVGTGGSPTPNVVHGIQQGFADLDRAYAEGGVASIDKVFSRGTTEEVVEAAHWAAESPKIPLIPTLVNALSDGRFEVRKGALAALMRMPALSVKPFLSSLNAAATSEPNPQFAGVLQAYAATVAQAR